MNDISQKASDYRSRIYERYGENFQDACETFDKGKAEQWGKPYKYYFRDWLPIDKAAKIVDLACGGGRMLHFFKQLGYKNLTGVDLSSDQVALSLQVTKNIKQQNVLEFLRKNPSSFDLITGLDIIEHFHKQEVLEFLDGCYAALKPNGRLVLQTPNADSPWGTVHRYNDFTHEVGFNPNSLSRLLGMCGFINIESREQGPPYPGFGLKSILRYLLWQAIRGGLMVWNLAEIGNSGSRVFTRVFLISAQRK